MSKHRQNGERIRRDRPYVELDRVCVKAGNDVMLREVSLSVNAGKVVRLDGPNGAGKSTVLRTVEGIEPIGTSDVTGRVSLFDRDMAALSPRERRKLIGYHVGVAFQSPRLADSVRVYQHLTSLVDLLGLSVSDRRAEEVADMFGLSDKLGGHVAPLSGGEKQRLDLARLALKSPDLWLLDEPTSAIDTSSKEIVFGAIRSFCDEGAAALIVSHDVQVAAYVDRTLLLEDGQLVHAS